MSTPSLRALDVRLLDQIFEMGGGYVLDFSNNTFAEFFEEIGIDIYNDRYAFEGESKAKRLRCFLRKSPPELAVKAIAELWRYREAVRRMNRQDDELPNAKDDIERLLARLGGKSISEEPSAASGSGDMEPDKATLARLNKEFIELSQLEPHPRGFAFERFLKGLFDAYGLGARASFRQTGEQIDGSFELRTETYLLEARWRNEPADAAALRAFNAKVEDKAAWSRGLFLSQNGFSDDGLVAFGRRNSIVCMDGLDLHETITGSLTFPEVIARKVRRAAETGRPFVRFRELFPEKD